MTTVAEAYTQIIDIFRTAWLADGNSSVVPIVYDNVEGSDPPDGEDPVTNRVLPWCRISVRDTIEDQECLGPPGQRRFKNEGIVTVEIYTAVGDGYALGDVLARVAKLSFRGNSTSGGVHFFRVTSRKLGRDPLKRAWARVDVTADYWHEDRG